MNGKIMKHLCAAAIGSLALFGGDSLAASLKPPTPTASKGTTTGYVRVTWARVSGASYYIIKRGTSASYASAVYLKKVSGSVTALNDTSVITGWRYYYWVCPCNAKGTYWYNTGRYDWGYAKSIKITPSPTPSGAYISGASTLKYGSSTKYYLYVGGKKITASSVAWSRSGLATMQDKGSYGLLKATSRPASSTNKVYVYATYGGKRYSKTVTITR